MGVSHLQYEGCGETVTHTAELATCLEGLDAILLRSLDQEGLLTVLAIPPKSGVVCRHFGRRPGTIGQDGVHAVIVTVWC
jgi:N-formylglutamate amidohydrolase